MVRLSQERVLLIGDAKRDVQSAIAQAAPGAQVTSVATVFDGIAELSANAFTTVMAAVEPIQRRPEAAVRALRELARDGRLILFGQPDFELLNRKMMQFGCDDYIVTPARAAEVQQIFGTPRLRIAQPPPEGEEPAPPGGPTLEPAAPDQPASAFASVPVADVLLDAMLQHPHDAASAAVRAIHSHIAPRMGLSYRRAGGEPSAPGAG